MFKIKQLAVVIAAALWFTSDTFAHENKDSSNLEESDFYFKDISLNESSHDSNPLKTEITDFDKNGEHESIDKLHSKDTDEYFSVGNLKRLIRYFVSLLHSIEENNSHDAEFLQDYKFQKKQLSRKNKVKANQTSSTPGIYKSSYTENTRDTEFGNSGEGNDSEYYEERNNFKNPFEEKPRIKTLKSNTKRKPRVRNHGRISGGQQRNSDDNQKHISENFRFNRHRANHSDPRNGQVSDEFIDEYINPPTEKVFMKSYEETVTNEPIISSERENQTVILLKESPREENVSEGADRTSINPQSLNADNVSMDMKTTFHKEVVKEDFLINDSEESNDTNHKTFSNQNRNMENKNVKEIAAVESTQNHFHSNKSPHFISNKPQNNKNGTSTFLSEEFTTMTSNENFSSPEESELSRSQKPKISSVRKYVYDRTPKNFSVLDDSRYIKSLIEKIQSPEPQIELESTASYKAENESLRQPPKSTKSFTVLRDFNETNRLRSQNSSTDRKSKTDRGDQNERHFVKHPKLEEKETKEYSYASEGLKSRTDSNTNTGSSNSNTDNWTKMQSGSVSNKAEGGSSQWTLNSTKTFTIPRDCNETNRLLLTKNSTDTEQPNEQHFVEHPKLEEKETREFSIAHQKSKVQTDLDTDSDSSDYSDSDEDSWTQMQSGSSSYKAKNVSSQQLVNSAQSFTMPVESNKTNRLLSQNTSTDAESKNDKDIPSEQHFVKHPKPEEKEKQEFSSASWESKVQTDSDSSDLEELYEYYEYDDEDIQLMSNFASYFTGNSSNTSTTSSENFTAPFTNYSVEIELPTSSRNDSKINTPHKTQELYNSIIEFLYKYSNSTWIKNLKEENRRI